MASFMHIVEYYGTDGEPCLAGESARIEITHLEGDELDQVLDDLEADIDEDDDEDEDDEDSATLHDVCPLCGSCVCD